ncbi:MAG: hypothetical protein GY772_07685 [bacterium]|nr:hypothetical protein [bacterium]
MDSAQWCEFAVWAAETTVEGGVKAVEVLTAPGTRRFFWAGREAELRRRGPLVAEGDDGGEEKEEEEEDDEEDEDVEKSEEDPEIVEVVEIGPQQADTAKRLPRSGASQPAAEAEPFPWLAYFAPGHWTTNTKVPEDAEIKLTYVRTRASFEARFLLESFPQDAPKGFRMRQKTRNCKVKRDAAIEHEAFRLVLLWLWQKFAVVQKQGRLPDHVAKMIGPCKSRRLGPCVACAEGNCRAMEEGAAFARAQTWRPPRWNAMSDGPAAGLSIRLPLISGGASQPNAMPAAELIKCPAHGDCLFIALAFVKIACIDQKPWPADRATQISYGAKLRSFYLKWAETLLQKGEHVVDDVPLSTVITASTDCSADEYLDRVRVPTMDIRTWGGWTEIVVLAAKWKCDIALFWRCEGEAELRGRTQAGRPAQVRPAVLYSGSHYDALRLSTAAWAAVDARLAAA